MNRADSEKAIRGFQAQFVKRHVPAGASGEVFRAAQRFALIGAAGELATRAGITGWAENESANAAEKCYTNWLARRVGGSGAGDAEAAIRQVRNFIEVNGAGRFQPAKVRLDARSDPIPEKVINRAGFRTDNAGGDAVEYLILPEVFQREVCAGFDYRMVARALSERGYLDCEPQRLTKKPRLPEVGVVRVYAVKASILGNERAEYCPPGTRGDAVFIGGSPVVPAESEAGASALDCTGANERPMSGAEATE